MKKTLSIALVALMAISTASAQSSESQWTLNTRAWTTNYWTDIIYSAARGTVIFLTTEYGSDDMRTLERIIPNSGLVFPVGIEKAGFADPNDIYGPYHYAFGNPFKNVGDFGMGIDLSWRPSFVGVYAGGYFKSQEIVFNNDDSHLRGFYFQPRAGLVFGRNKTSIEAGVFYDKTFGCWSNAFDTETTMLSDGLGLDVALNYFSFSGTQFIIQFSMPFHNFLNDKYPDGRFEGMHRRVGYIMLTQRITL